MDILKVLDTYYIIRKYIEELEKEVKEWYVLPWVEDTCNLSTIRQNEHDNWFYIGKQQGRLEAYRLILRTLVDLLPKQG